MFDLMRTFVPIFILAVFGLILFSIIKGIGQWSYNNKQPVLTVCAKVVGKRTHVSHTSRNHDNHVHTSSSTSYYVSFEVESGDRLEFLVGGTEYGQTVEGDMGHLTFQGTRYKGFTR